MALEGIVGIIYVAIIPQSMKLDMTCNEPLKITTSSGVERKAYVLT